MRATAPISSPATCVENHTYYCYWYDIPSGYGTVYIYKYYCDPAFDWENGSYDYLYSGCTNPQTDVYFEVNSGSYSQGQTTDSSGAATWTDVPTGDAEIVEQLPDGYQVGRIFCGVTQQNGGTQPTSWDEYTYSNGYHVQVPSGQYLHCYIFDIPSDYGTLYLYKYYCDPTFDWQSNGYDYLLSGCTNPQSDVYFEVNSGSYSEGQTTDSSGTAAWSNVPSGTLDITEQSPDGYTVGRVFCGYSSDSSSPPSSWDEYTYNQGIQVESQSGQYLFCVYFNVPSDYGTIYLYKYYCDPTFDWENGGYDYLLSGCANPQSDVYFDGTSGSYSQGQTTDSSGAASWTGVPAGDFGFVEQPPDGYQVGRIFCGYTDTQGTPPTSWDEYSYSDGWSVPYETDQYLYCYGSTFRTTTARSTCTSTTAIPRSIGRVAATTTCIQVAPPRNQMSTSSSQGGSYTQGQTTDSSGAATWSDVPWGDLSFYEEVPDGYQVGRIFCGYSDSENYAVVLGRVQLLRWLGRPQPVGQVPLLLHLRCSV